MKVRRSLLYLLAGLLLGELVYVGAFEWAAQSGRLAEWVNRRPEKFQMEWRVAHSYLPFHVRLEGLDLSVRSPRLEWRLRCDSASGWIPPAPLLTRRLRVEGAALDGAQFGLRRRADAAPAAAPADPAAALAALAPSAARAASALRADLLPPVPAFAAAAPGESPRRSRRVAWSFEFPRVAATRIREIWLQELRVTGELQGRGGFAIRRRKEAEVSASRIEVRHGTATLGGQPLGQNLLGALGFSTAPYAYREHRGLAALPFLDATTTLAGDLTAAPLLRRYLARAPWLELDDSPAPFTAQLELRHGAFAAGSHLHTERAVQAIRFFGFEAKGTSQLSFDVRPAGATDQAEVVLREDDFELRRTAGAAAVAAGSGLVVRAWTRDLRPNGLPNDGHLAIDLGEAHLLDLAGFSDLLPPSAGLTLAGGRGSVRGVFEADLGASGPGSANGTVGATITEAAMISNGVRFTGTLRLDVPIVSHDLAGRVFDLAGTHLELTDFRGPAGGSPEAAPAVAEPGWWGRVDVGRATLRLTEPPIAEGELTVHLRDSVPLVELYASRQDLPAWVEKLLVEPDVVAAGSYSYSRPELTIRDLRARFEHWGFTADLELGKERRRGLLLLEWRKLALGVRLEGDQRTFKLAGARDWFAKEKL